MKIAIIGTGNIGSTVGRLLSDAGHEILFGSRHPDRTVETAPHARVLPIDKATASGEIVLCAAPYGKWPDLAPQIADGVAGKLVIDAANPNEERDGAYAADALADPQGSGRRVAALLPGSSLVRTFSTLRSDVLGKEAHRDGARLGLPIAGDDASARDVAAELVRNAGFDPVDVGPLDAAKRFDTGTKVYNSGMTGDEVRRALGLAATREAAQ